MGQISEIIDVQKISSDVDLVIAEIDALDKRIEQVNGNVLRVKVEMAGAESVAELTAATEEYKKTSAELNTVSKENTATSQKHAAVTAELTEAMAAQNLTTREANQLKALTAKLNNEVAGSYNAMSAEMALNTIALHKYNIEQTKTDEGALKLIARNKELQASMLALDTAQGKFGRQVGNYKLAVGEAAVAAGNFNVVNEKITHTLETVGEHIERHILRHLYRMAAEFVIVTLVIEGVSKLWEMWNKVDVAQKEATERAKEYHEEVKGIAKDMEAFSAKRAANIELEYTKAEQYLNTLTDQKSGIDAQREAYTKLDEIMHGVMKNYTIAEAATGKGNAAIREQIENLGALQGELKTLQPLYEKQVAIFEKHQEKIDKEGFQKGSGYIGELTQFENQEAAVNKSKARLIQLQTEIDQITAKPEKEKEKEKPNAKLLDSELDKAKATYKLQLEKNQELFNKSNHLLGVDDKAKAESDLQAFQEYYANATSIIIKWHGRAGESEDKYKARLIQAKADELAVENATNEEERKIALEIQKRHDEANKQLDELVNKMREQRIEIQNINRDIDEIQAGAAAHKLRAGGVSPLLEALGFDADFAENQAAFDRQIAAAKSKHAELKGAEYTAYLSGHPLEYGAAQKNTAGNEKDIADLEAQKQKAIDDKVIEAKKEAAQKTIELAQATFDALKTIQEQQFAWEQQQIEYEMQSNKIASDQKIQAIDATAGFQIEKDNEKAKVAAQNVAKEKELQAKSNELALKHAIAEKKMAELSIITNTAAAIVKTIAAYAGIPGGIALAVPIIAIEAAIGAAQYAAAASAPLPQFEKGGITTTSKIIAGEQGKEMGVTPQGKLIMFNKAGVYSDVPIGTNIKTADETNRILKSMVWSSYGLPQAQNNGMTDKNIVQELQETRETMMQIGMMQARQQPKVIVIKENNYLQRPRR